MGVLTIFLDKITNLVDKDVIGKADPYVKIHVEHDRWGPIDKNYGNCKSTKKKGDLNPVYQETFTIEIPNLKGLVMQVKVMDDDPGLDDKMGSCMIKLEDLGLTEQPTAVEKVIDNNLIRKDAKIFLQLSYTE